MSEPDYVVCMECESPAYTFDWREGRLIGAVCALCGNDDLTLFATEEQMEEFAGVSEED